MSTFDVVGIGNAIVDVISPADDSFLALMGIEKGIMQLIEQERGGIIRHGAKMMHAMASASVPKARWGISAWTRIWSAWARLSVAASPWRLSEASAAGWSGWPR